MCPSVPASLDLLNPYWNIAYPMTNMTKLLIARGIKFGHTSPSVFPPPIVNRASFNIYVWGCIFEIG